MTPFQTHVMAKWDAWPLELLAAALRRSESTGSRYDVRRVALT